MTPIEFYIALAVSQVSTTYGYGERNTCGDIGKPVPCAWGATTATGKMFNPDEPVVAVPMPTRRILRKGSTVKLRALNGRCITLPVIDKKNPRFIATGGLDLSKGALRLLGIKPSRTWSGRLEAC